MLVQPLTTHQSQNLNNTQSVIQTTPFPSFPQPPQALFPPQQTQNAPLMFFNLSLQSRPALIDANYLNISILKLNYFKKLIKNFFSNVPTCHAFSFFIR